MLQSGSSTTTSRDSGNMCANRTHRTTGAVTGSMRLKGFRHRLPTGCQPVGTDDHL
ncbi:hypothetical protein [Streptomyces sp. bgisy060]|uniref:hypothetical protein n=1 Tax=Streptomyces sp. bgisy060 TaxID=3413775 RepID=UPI003EBCF509